MEAATLYLESVQGSGTSAFIYSGRKPDTKPDAKMMIQRRESMRIAVVEDETVIREGMANILQKIDPEYKGSERQQTGKPDMN